MKRIVLSVIFALALAFGGSHNAQATNANDAAVSWTVVGSIQGLPNRATPVTFSCTVTAAQPYCETNAGILYVTFVAADTTHIGIVLQPTQVCGVTASTCVPTLVSGTESQSVTCTSSVYAASAVLTYKFPCSGCFGGLTPFITIQWNATAAC